MRVPIAAVALVFSGEAGAATLETSSCPFDDGMVTTHRAACSRFSREDNGTRIAFDLAILTPDSKKSVGHVLYIPGGPGEAPVAEDGPYPDMLFPFASHTIILFNPRGTEGTAPRLDCDFGETVLSEDFGNAQTRDILRDCIERIDTTGPDPSLFTSHHIASDVDALVTALGLSRIGLYGISYGTEAGLHLLAENPSWLDFVILDSVSVPGLSGVRDEIMGQERFLATLDTLCFIQKTCTRFTRRDAATLSDWAAQFDADPLVLHLADEMPWTFDGADMLEFLAQFSAYRDGLTMARSLIEMLVTGRLRALGWMKATIEADIDFMRDNLPLMLQAYADTYHPDDIETVRRPIRYDRDIEASIDLLALYRLWRGTQPREAHFLGQNRQDTPVPTLVMSGGLDPFTPPEWAVALHTRFAGLEHYLYPLLGHAVSVDAGSTATGPEMAAQLHCASAAIRVFLDPTLNPDDTCQAYRAKGTQ